MARSDDDAMILFPWVVRVLIAQHVARSLLRRPQAIVGMTRLPSDHPLADAVRCLKEGVGRHRRMTPNYGDTHFTGFEPIAFARLRRSFRIGEAAYARSLGPAKLWRNNNFFVHSSNSKGGQARGTGFFLSSNGRFMIKTQTKAECAELLRLLPSYVEFMKKHPDSWLVRFYGLYRVDSNDKGVPAVHFAVMNNVFDTRQPLVERYDLKGSTVGRRTEGGTAATLKDLDLLHSNSRVLIGAARRPALLGQLRRDAQFLRERSYMDYSLLLGIHRPRLPVLARVSHALRFRRRQTDGVLSSNGRNLYYMGVIDVLQTYSLKKCAETCLKSLRFPVWGISCVWPSAYSRRFCTFLERVIT